MTHLKKRFIDLPRLTRAFRGRGRKTSGATVTALFLLALAPDFAFGCACGCGVFEVGTSSMFPSGTGGVAYLEFDHLHQNTNWSGTSRASNDDNNDKLIHTNFYTAGLNYMFSHEWGMMVKLPYTDRTFKTDTGDGDIATFKDKSIGDIRVEAMYTGFSPDMSTGVTFGLKLPTGDYTNPNFDRDTEIGSGSTDLLLGAYHLGVINRDWSWFAQGVYQRAIATRATVDADSGMLMDYRPGDELNVATGVSYDFGEVGVFSKVAFIGQIKGSFRARDTDAAADNLDTGYSRALLAPGIEADIGRFRMYADIEVPVYQRVNGDQLVAPVLLKMLVGYSF